MRILVATFLLGSTTLAAADPDAPAAISEPATPVEPDPGTTATSAPGETPVLASPIPSVIDQSAGITAGAGAEQIGRDANGSVSGEAHAVYHETRERYLSTFEAKAGATLRSGSSGTDGAANVDGRFTLAHAAVPDRPIVGGWASAELGARPTLDARRDVARAVFADAGAGFQLGLAGQDGDRVRGVAYANIGGTLQAQSDATRATYTFDLDLYYSCRLRPDARARCLHILDTYSLGVSGKTQAVVTNMYFVRWTGLDLGRAWGDVGIGGITNGTKLSIDNTNDTKPPTTVQTEDLPRIDVLSWNAGIATMFGPVEVEARTQRTGYVSLDGDMSIEDRASVTAALPLAAHTKLGASGFAARTQWWTSKTDPGSHANTGGAELALDTRLHDFDVHAGAGVARSFYAVLDGGAADRPALGFRSAIDVRHSIKNWVP